jgi:hypothetical protein
MKNPNEIPKEQIEKDIALLQWIINCSLIPTADLIAELEKRRPCKKCKSWTKNSTPCMTCFWKYLWVIFQSDLETKDNFKEAK